MFMLRACRVRNAPMKIIRLVNRFNWNDARAGQKRVRCFIFVFVWRNVDCALEFSLRSI
jgi:hypothetical protein